MTAALITLALGAGAQAAAAEPPSVGAARCKAAAHALQEGLSIPTNGWRDHQRDWTWWDARHRRDQPDAAQRARQDADAAYAYGAQSGVPAAQRRSLATRTSAQCRRLRGSAR